MAAKKKTKTQKRASAKSKPAVVEAVTQEPTPPVEPTVEVVAAPPQPAPNPIKIVNIKCRREGCPSTRARESTLPGVGTRLYHCVKCGNPLGVNVGGNANF